MERRLTVKDFADQDVTVRPELFLYAVKDYIGRDVYIPGIQLYTEDHEPFATVTKSFGEFIGIKNCCYMDINNCPFATVLLDEGVAKDTGFTKQSGWCSYPLWVFDEKFLKEIGGEKYEQYSEAFDDCIHRFGGDEETNEDFGDEYETPELEQKM